MHPIAEKIRNLGGELRPPASQHQIAAIESLLGISLPTSFRSFLLQHNGTSRETDAGIWNFWPCENFTSYAAYRGKTDFFPDTIDKRFIDNENLPMRLNGQSLILFADALIELPLYGMYLDPQSPFHGFVFDADHGYLSAESFDLWVTLFIKDGEHGLLIS
jgi:hypothetical protein